MSLKIPVILEKETMSKKKYKSQKDRISALHREQEEFILQKIDDEKGWSQPVITEGTTRAIERLHRAGVIHYDFTIAKWVRAIPKDSLEEAASVVVSDPLSFKDARRLAGEWIMLYNLNLEPKDIPAIVKVVNKDKDYEVEIYKADGSGFTEKEIKILMDMARNYI